MICALIQLLRLLTVPKCGVSFLHQNAIFNADLPKWNEVTRTVVGDRRTKLLNELVQLDPITISAQAVRGHIITVLQNNGQDVPMFLLYSAEETERGNDCRLCLEGSAGIVEGHAAAPKEIHLSQANAGFGPSLRRAHKSPLDWIALDHDADEFPSEVSYGIDWQGWGEPSRTIVVMPVTVLNKLVKGFLILGLNPRKAFDAEHQQFISALQRQLISLMQSFMTVEDARRREAKLIKELTVSERRIRTLAELAPSKSLLLHTVGFPLWRTLPGRTRRTSVLWFGCFAVVKEVALNSSSVGAQIRSYQFKSLTAMFYSGTV